MRPKLETEKYTREVLADASPSLDHTAFALLEEDLRSPCTEEIAVFRAFADTVASRDSDFVVLDTAPTGHTLLLLDAAEAYHREVTRKLSDIPDAVRELLPRLRDPQATRVILVTLPEATPVHEAARLQDDGAAAFPELVVEAVKTGTPEASARCRETRDEIQRFPFHSAMKRILADIQSGKFADEWMTEHRCGEPHFRELRKAAAAHPIEQVGQKLRDMMPWLASGRLVDRSKN